MACFTVEEVIDMLHDDDVVANEPICEGSEDDFLTEEEEECNDSRQDEYY